MPDPIKCALAKKILEDFLARFPHARGDASVYSSEAWAARREPYGKNSLATMSVDGSPLYAALNGYSRGCTKELEELDAALEAAGCYTELGTSVHLHVYEI